MQRTSQTKEEKEAIQAAENLDLPSYLATERFNPYYGDYCTNEMDVTDGYAWPRLVDGMSLSHYEDRYHYVKERGYLMSASFSYEAECLHLDEMSVQLWNRTYGHDGYRTEYGLNSSHEFGEFDYGDLRFLNLAGIAPEDDWYKLSDIYVIRQLFKYNEVEAPLAGYFGYVDQLIILDSEFNILMILVDTMSGIS